MTTQPGENEDQGQVISDQNAQASGDNNGGHPAWQSILDVVPESLHSIIRPELEKWDQGVNHKLQSVRSQYDPYKPFIDEKVDPEFLQQAVNLASMLQNDPEAVISEAIRSFNLPYVPANQQEEQEEEEYEYSNDDGFDITKHPAYIAQQTALEQMQERFNSMDAQEQAAAQQTQMEKYLGDLEAEHGTFDRLYVTALIAQGVDGVAAVNSYKDIVNQAAASAVQGTQQSTSQQPPVVMGSSGAAGSGVPDNTVSLGSLKRDQVNEIVKQMIQNANQSD